MTPFNVQVNFEILVFEGQIDADVLDELLNLIEVYFLVYDFFDGETIMFPSLWIFPVSNIGGRTTVRKHP